MWDLTGLFELSRPSEDVVSVTFSVYSYTGGAHGNLEITCLNYDLRTGRRLDLADLFKDPEKALQLMSAWSQKELARSLGEDTDEDMIRDGVAPDLRNFANLTLTPQGLRIEFQPYQVAPWAAGPQRVDLWRNWPPAGPEARIWQGLLQSKVTLKVVLLRQPQKQTPAPEAKVPLAVREQSERCPFFCRRRRSLYR